MVHFHCDFLSLKDAALYSKAVQVTRKISSPLSSEELTVRAYYPITFDEMDTFLRHRGFTPIFIPNVKENVYGHLIDHNVCVRVYTGIVGKDSKGCVEHAIRVVIVKRLQSGKVIPVASKVSKVYRLENWRASLTTRIDNVIDFYYDSISKGKRTTV